MNETPKSPSTEDLPGSDRGAGGEKPAVAEARIPLIPEAEFDEAGYLRLNQDVRKAVETGKIKSGYAHYVSHGNAEGRILPGIPKEPRNVLLQLPPRKRAPDDPYPETNCAVDEVTIAPGAGIFVSGWIDDAAYPLDCIRVMAEGWRAVIDVACILRSRRQDVEQIISPRKNYTLGFNAFCHFDRAGGAATQVTVELWQKGERVTTRRIAPAIVSAEDLRDGLLTRLASVSFFGNGTAERAEQLERGLGNHVVRLNRAIAQRAVSNPYVEQFGPTNGSSKGSIIVPLAESVDRFFIQNCAFSGNPGIEDYEFIYVCNSPRIGESVLREARSAAIIYGLDVRVMVLAANAGLATAANAAAGIARSDRILVLSPDVLPRDLEWAKKHTDLLISSPEAQTSIFGLLIFYDSGSLMHAGIHFETETHLSLSREAVSPVKTCVAKYYGRDAPLELALFQSSRSVSAIGGEFMSIDRGLFERLGGINEDYALRGYADADFCLRAAQQGVVPWIHNIQMWTIAGSGACSDAPGRGAEELNRWLFSRSWLVLVEAQLETTQSRGEPPGRGREAVVNGEVAPILEPKESTEAE